MFINVTMFFILSNKNIKIEELKMTIFIEEYIEKGYCKWDRGKIVVNATCPKNVREELEAIDSLWMEQNNTKEHLVIFA